MPRVHYCLDQLSEEQIWHRPNEASNAVGNLVLHLCGNARQWIVAGLGKAPDTRNRDLEFSTQDGVSAEELHALLRRTEKELEGELKKLSPEDLQAEYDIQAFRENGVSVLIHVIEHFSYHTGQITYIVKMLKNINTGYYTGIDLNSKE